MYFRLSFRFVSFNVKLQTPGYVWCACGLGMQYLYGATIYNSNVNAERRRWVRVRPSASVRPFVQGLPNLLGREGGLWPIKDELSHKVSYTTTTCNRRRHPHSENSCLAAAPPNFLLPSFRNAVPHIRSSPMCLPPSCFH